MEQLKPCIIYRDDCEYYKSDSEYEIWNGYHGQTIQPKGMFDKIWEDAESEGEELIEKMDSIRAEISKLQTYKCFEDTEKLVALDEVLQIIDK